MVKKAGIGDLEMELVNYIAENGPVRVREAVSEFGEERGLARATVVTMLDRLCKKSVLTRSKKDKFYMYELKVPLYQILKKSMNTFFQKTLGGSISPLVTYLSQEREYSDEEIQELKEMVNSLEKRQKSKE
ncbi:MAG TPA: methicillin resistance protein [Myxococcales bacterium]|nr:methicillin resistance protein [Deltaproteobacteria bacterium]HAA56077.1 methicillin resistance protein [Myxococcales bacterium]|tara:strand:+ start:3739 stop:4131 length:393 start_codon:yes stop_codon:yes gene_type:complete